MTSRGMLFFAVMHFEHRRTLLTTGLLLLGVAGCGGSTVNPPASAAAETTPTKAPVVQAAPRAAAVDEEQKPADPDESSVAIRLTPLFTKQRPPKFPKPTVSDRECWQDMELSGDATTDYAALVARCGAPTGVAEYVHPAKGHLHHKHDQRDTFKVALEKGYCYRYFAVADSTIDDLDILVTRYGGDMVGDDQTKGPVAIIQSDKPWCMDDDVDYDLEVAVDGKGQGNYLIGVWARPKGAT